MVHIIDDSLILSKIIKVNNYIENIYHDNFQNKLVIIFNRNNYILLYDYNNINNKI